VTALGTLPPTLKVHQLAALSDSSNEYWWKSVREGTCPIEPLRLGRSIRFSTRRVLEFFDLDADDAARALEGA
jgi:hypothetical protein